MAKCKFGCGYSTKGGAFGTPEGTAAAKRMKAHYKEKHSQAVAAKRNKEREHGATAVAKTFGGESKEAVLYRFMQAGEQLSKMGMKVKYSVE